MTYEIIVVGGGIGGLTAAALLAARGTNVCLLERQAQTGGCAAAFERFGYRFEAGAGLYTSWGPGEIHDRVFSELPVSPPEVRPVSPAYVVRLPDQTEVAITENQDEFEENLRTAFPESADAAIKFYRELAPIDRALRRAVAQVPDLRTASRLRQLAAFVSSFTAAPRILRRMNEIVAKHLGGTSWRFRCFVDAQLQIFAQCSSDECAYLYGAVALMIPRRPMFASGGGAQAMADCLTESIKKSGGTVRVNAPVLRLAYAADGKPIGVDLLSGETVFARRAIVSNLTVWDTYGKLVGLSRIPEQIRGRLKRLRGWGAYLIFLGMEDSVSRRLPADHILCLTDWQEGQHHNPEQSQMMFAAAPDWDARGPEGKRAVTVCTFTEAEQWFAFHKDEAELESRDQSALESCWAKLHRAMPELGDGVEVIDTATPRTLYENTRRKLGMAGGVGQSLDVFGPKSFSHRTIFPNLFMVGDSTFPGQGIAAVTHAALVVANELTR